MNQKLLNFLNSSKHFLGKHSPEILTGIGITGMITSTVLAVKATPKALKLIEYKKEELDVEELTTIETIKTAWRPFIPSVSISLASMACLIGASATNYKRNAALASAYAISERTLTRYRDKVIETIGERKERNINEKVAQDKVEDNKLSDNQVIITSKGNTLCMDSLSGRYFKSDIETIKQIVNKLNRRLLNQNYISLNELYDELGLKDIKNGELMGWNLDSGLIEPIFNTCLAEDGQPCIVIDFVVNPKYGYDKLM